MKTMKEPGQKPAGTAIAREEGRNRRIKMAAALLVVGVLCLAQASAAGTIGALDTAGEKILALIGAKWVKALLAVALIIEFGVIAFGNAQGEGGMIKKVLPWIIGTGGILGATSIVNYFFGSVKSESLAFAADAARAMGSAAAGLIS